jgi:hypothetical protein
VDERNRIGHASWIRRVATSPGVRYWGLPVAVTGTIAQVLYDDGLHWTTFLSARFAIRLVVAIIVVGVYGGRLFEWGMVKTLGAVFDKKL